MTRKKWNRLRRQRPDLFEAIIAMFPHNGYRAPGWEIVSENAKAGYPKAARIVRASKFEAIEILTAWHVTRKLEQ